MSTPQHYLALKYTVGWNYWYTPFAELEHVEISFLYVKFSCISKSLRRGWRCNIGDETTNRTLPLHTREQVLEAH